MADLRAVPDPQTALHERDVDDADLERLLDERETQKSRATAARKSFEGLDSRMKLRLGELGIEDGQAVRVGQYRIERRPVKSQSVSFERAAASRYVVKTVKE